jgi:predicted nucleic acid-binding protein
MASINQKIFIDSSVLTAFIDRGNSRHLLATKSIEVMASFGYRIYTSPPTIAESYSELMKQVGTTIALEFLQTILQSGIEIVYLQKTDLNSAYRILKANRTERISLSEALTAAMMQRKGIMEVLTFRVWNNLFGTSTRALTSQ